jgi:S1-C subfamily serine protease
MRRITLFLAVCLLLTSPAAGLAGPEDSVVKVLATLRYPKPLKPWTHGTPVDVLGSGTVIDGKRILTNAHLVLYATDVQVQPRRGGSKIEAWVEALAPDMDLAVLSVKDDTFFRKCPPLRRTTRLPQVQDAVAVYGFPEGGSDLAVTKGVVSRIDFGAYYQQAMGLIIQVSAAINAGNSAGRPSWTAA